MKQLFEAINSVFGFIVPFADFLWDFPTNFEWYANIPLLGNFSLAIILLVGSGIYFTLRLRFIQVTHFKAGIKTLMRKQSENIGISPLAAFLLSSAMRVGPGNIVGVTGAILVGGPGALFWMWISAFLGMATAFMEATLAQIFKERKKDEFVGGLPFYGSAILGNKAFVGVVLSVVYIVYAMFCIPAQAFNVFSSVGQIAATITGVEYSTTSVLYIIIAVVLVVLTVYVAFGGIKKVTRLTDKLVPFMAVVYIAAVLILIVLNVDQVPYFFTAVFGGAFKPEAIFGGLMGAALAQGVKRGLMSNEAGQGTITMSAAASDAKHPCEQGCVQAIGVFLDTIIICTLSGFVVVLAHLWISDSAAFELVRDAKFPAFLASLNALTPGTAFDGVMTLVISVCYGLFAYTCLIGMICFAEIAANRISRAAAFINFIRGLGALVFVPFGILCLMAGLELGNLWYISDLGNIIIVYFNLPIIHIGAKYVFRATAHFRKNDDTPFTSKVVGIPLKYWDERAKEKM